MNLFTPHITKITSHHRELAASLALLSAVKITGLVLEAFYVFISAGDFFTVVPRKHTLDNTLLLLYKVVSTPHPFLNTTKCKFHASTGNYWWIFAPQILHNAVHRAKDLPCIRKIIIYGQQFRGQRRKTYGF